MSYASFTNAPPYYKRELEAYYDEGNGIPMLSKDNMTPQDIYKNSFLFTQDHRKDYNAMVTTAEKTISLDSELAKVFFSDKRNFLFHFVF